MSELNLLFIGDIVGRIGRETVKRLLPEIKKDFKIDTVIANGENAAHGKGITVLTANELIAAGVNAITTGDHCFDQPSNIEGCFGGDLPIIRPANYNADAPGTGHIVLETSKGPVLVINLIGRAFMARHYECPFKAADRILQAFTDKKFSAIIVDIHAEATSEKIALRHFLNGRVSALAGTHTHVMTADHQITAEGTGYITDTGMNGAADGVIGVETEPVLASFLTQIKQPQRLGEAGPALFNALVISVNPVTGKCLSVQPVQRHVDIQY